MNKLLENVLERMKKEHIYEMCSITHMLDENERLYEANDDTERQRVVNMMKDEANWIVNDYEGFLSSLTKSQFMSFLTPYTIDDLKTGNIETYKLKDYNIGFALKHNGTDVDIISVHNNEPNIRNISNELLTKAKELGGNTLDHFEGKLSDIYQRNGFEEYDRWAWNDEYAPKAWDYDKYGRPDVVFRRLKQ